MNLCCSMVLRRTWRTDIFTKTCIGTVHTALPPPRFRFTHMAPAIRLERPLNASLRINKLKLRSVISLSHLAPYP